MNNSGIIKQSWVDAIHVYSKPRVIAMVFLGFSAGLPFLLVFSTLSAWLRDAGVALTTIGFFSWIGITYSIKFFWAPVIDRLPLPILTKALGKRRSWMILAQFMIGGGLVGLSICDPLDELQLITVFALTVAFGSATQDVTIDAYRIEAIDKAYQGAMAASYVFGYRVALLVAGAGAFYLASFQSWSFAYLAMACLMLVGVTTTLILREPEHRQDGNREREANLEQSLGINRQKDLFNRVSAWFVDAVVMPFIEFFERFGRHALIILLLVSCYRISDITMGVMANPFYLDMGFSKTDIANVTKLFGFFMTIFGAGLGGIIVLRFGIMRPLLAGAILVVLTNLLFVWLAKQGPDLAYLAVVVSADNFSGGFATSAFIAYLSSLTNQSYTATQYALFSSLMTLPAKILGGYSGMVVDATGYASFFLYAGLLGLPAILLVLYLAKRQQPLAS
ncbi:MAG TPA: AmpG family muropeptide MFS transporter [Gammaproteobacteria bacterium]|nr:AmpG family muropeptide MFS transporter [Gammaproteobacteria bacterium]